MVDRVYYRLDARLFDAGDIITGDGALALTGTYPELEAMLEARRPSSCYLRTNCVYMSELQSIRKMGVGERGSKYCYEVQPLTPVQMRDVNWIGALQIRTTRFAANPNESIVDTKVRLRLQSKFSQYTSLSKEEITDKYWSGEPSTLCEYEYVAEKAEVLRRSDCHEIIL